MNFEKFLNESAKKITADILNEMDDWGDFERHVWGSGRMAELARRYKLDPHDFGLLDGDRRTAEDIAREKEANEWLKKHPVRSTSPGFALMNKKGEYTADKHFDPKECEFLKTGKPYAKFVKSETGTKYDKDITSIRRELANIHKQLRYAAKTWADGCNMLHGKDLLKILKKYNVKIDSTAKEFIREELTLPWNGPHGSLKIANTLMKLLPKIESLATK